MKQYLLEIIKQFKEHGLEDSWGFKDRSNFLIHLSFLEYYVDKSTDETNIKKDFDILLVGSVIRLMMSQDELLSPITDDYQFLYPKSYKDFVSSSELGEQPAAVLIAKELGRKALIEKTLPFIGEVPTKLFPNLVSPFQANHFDEYQLNTKPASMDTTAISIDCTLRKNSKELFQKIKAMSDYGVLLREQDISKGQVATDLATDLTDMVNQFFAKPPEQRNFSEFEPEFLTLLHSKDQVMSAYRISWGTIVSNIAIALTGIGLLLIAGKLIHSKVTEGRALFFFQKNQTTSEEKIADIQQAVGNTSALRG